MQRKTFLFHGADCQGIHASEMDLWQVERGAPGLIPGIAKQESTAELWESLANEPLVLRSKRLESFRVDSIRFEMRPEILFDKCL